MRINESGRLEIGGCDTTDLARTFGTPLQIIDEQLLRRNCKEYRTSFETGGHTDLVLYASKALLNKAICRIIMEEGLGLDVVSGGELFIALQGGFPPDRIYLHGNNKSPEELEYALDSGVGRVVLDNYFELETLDRLAGRAPSGAAAGRQSYCASPRESKPTAMTTSGPARPIPSSASPWPTGMPPGRCALRSAPTIWT